MILMAMAQLLLAQRAPVHVDARLSVYSDSDQTTVVSPYVSVDAPAAGGTASAAFTADIITTASVDIRTMASPSVIHDFRRQFSGGYAHPFDNTTVSGSYVYSQENDYLSNGGHLGVTQDLFEKNVTLALVAGFRHDLIWRAHDFAAAKPLDDGSLSAIYTQVLTPRTLSSLSYDLDYGNGFQASPYRYAFFSGGSSDPGYLGVPENDPPVRTRHAWTAKIAQSLSSWTSIQGDYRFYADSWGLLAHTGSARLFLEPGNAWTLRFMVRGYTQNDASFYRPIYSAPVAYMTADRELSQLWSLLGGVKVIYNWPARGTTKVFAVDGKLDVLYVDYLDYRFLSNRLATVVEFGVTVNL